MALNKNAFIRYQALDRCFRNPGRRYDILALLEECNEALFEFDPKAEGIKKRQLYDDIRFMLSEQGWSIPLEKYKEGRTVYYRYEDLAYSINNQPINQMEASHLKSAVQILSRFKGMPQLEWIEELLPKLDQTFSLSKNSEKVMSFDNNEYLKGIEHLSSLFNAITYKKTLVISYKSFKRDEPIQMVFFPYHLKQYNKRWFLIGKTQTFDTLSNLALDRIEDIKDSKVAYEENSQYDFDEYFEDVIGVTIPENAEVQKIELWADTNIAPYIRTKPIHESQSPLREDNGGFRFYIKVIPNVELESIILSFGDAIKVLEPEELKEKIKHRITKNLANYN